MVEEKALKERAEEKQGSLNCDLGDHTATGEINGGICSYDKMFSD